MNVWLCAYYDVVWHAIWLWQSNYDMSNDCTNRLSIKRTIVKKTCSDENKKATNKAKFAVVINFLWYIFDFIWYSICWRWWLLQEVLNMTILLNLWNNYVERLELFFDVNSIEQFKRQPIFLIAVGTEA